MLWSFVECINAMSTKCFQNAPSNVAPISVETMYTWQSMNEKKENSTSHDKHIFDSKTKYHKRGEDRQHTHPPYCSSITSTLFPSPKIQIIRRFLCNAKKQHKPFASQTSAFQTLYHIQQTAIPCLFPESNIHQTGLFFPVHKLETKSQNRWQRNQHVKHINMHINLCKFFVPKKICLNCLGFPTLLQFTLLSAETAIPKTNQKAGEGEKFTGQVACQNHQHTHQSLVHMCFIPKYLCLNIQSSKV